MGFALGTMQTAQFVGQSLGPVFGGLAADRIGYRSVFPISSGLIACSFLLVALFAQERFVAPSRSPSPEDGAGRGRRLLAMLTGTTLALLLALGTLRFAASVLSPVLSLYVKELSMSDRNIATVAGAVLSVTALTSSVAALIFGRLGDRLGLKRVLLVCCVGVALVHIPQALVSNTTQLLALRALQGIFVGGTMPTATALLARNTPGERRGIVFGLSNSVQAGGRALGPVLGAAIANLWGMRSVFLATSAVFFGVASTIALAVRSETAEFPAPISERSRKRAGAPTSGCS